MAGVRLIYCNDRQWGGQRQLFLNHTEQTAWVYMHGMPITVSYWNDDERDFDRRPCYTNLGGMRRSLHGSRYYYGSEYVP